MEKILNEEPINGVPVEFKEINKEDFTEYYNVEDKIIIDVNNSGYLDDRFSQLLDEDLMNVNTTVINAGVGQGKTTHIIEKAISFAEKKDYIVIVAVPSKNLIQQYYEDFCDKYQKYRIFDMSKIDESPLFKSEEVDISNVMDLIWKVNIDDPPYSFSQDKISTFKIHIMTTNTFLGNPGDDKIFPAKNKTSYFQKLITLCQENNKKLVVIFDEIHDSIHNFKEEYIINLWKFQGLIHKIYIVSATFNEASKEVIKYLSELTQKNIRIIESKRTIIPEKQSRLHLIFHDNRLLKKNKTFRKKLETIIESKQNFDIISYSKKQIEQLFSEDKGIESLRKIEKEVKFCYYDIFSSNDAKYSSEFINVGTNFSTGISIKKENHHFFIILPKRLNVKYLNNNGVFTSGMSAIIQTFARQRKVGDIYIVLPNPYSITRASLPYEDNIIDEIQSRFQKFNSIVSVDYTNINHQDGELEKAYEDFKKRALPGIINIHLADRTGMNPLNFPTKNRFIIEKGEKYLTSIFFDGDLSTYVYFAAITNQFLNCKLTSLSYQEDLYYNSENLTLDLLLEYQSFIYNLPNVEEYEIENLQDFNYITGISKNKILKLLIEYYSKRKCYIDNVFTINTKILQILTLYVIYDDFIKVTKIIETENKASDVITAYYFQSCVKFSDNTINSDVELLDDQLFLVNFFEDWKQFLDIIDVLIESNDRIISKKPKQEFVNLYESLNFSEKIVEFIRTDLLVKTQIINFSDNWRKKKSDEEKRIEFFYKMLVESFYDFKDKQIPQGDGTRPRMYTEVKRKNLDGIHNLLFEV